MLENHNLTQESFTNKLNRQYYQYFSQKDVSRWTNIGSTYPKKIGFPKFQTMILIAVFFDVDVGYVTGKTNYLTFSLAQASEYTGMSPIAIQKKRQFSISDNINNLMIEDQKHALNKFFTANNIELLYYNLYDLYLISTDPERTSKLTHNNTENAINYLRQLEHESKIIKYELNESLILLINGVFQISDF
ncbi:hypothetical protein [Jeotgalibaca dankookensis]|uniref:hypothetical protein n=1 Tax=Jeotgalibaca dankookensis TaxID=708126 RepID=UPI000783C20A|nr:hypothetical protein [Jeotgalibaca dankookensis]